MEKINILPEGSQQAARTVLFHWGSSFQGLRKRVLPADPLNLYRLCPRARPHWLIPAEGSDICLNITAFPREWGFFIKK